MSIELPEAIILTKQMNEVLIGKKVNSHDIMNYERLQRVGFINKNINGFTDRLQKGEEGYLEISSLSFIFQILLALFSPTISTSF